MKSDAVVYVFPNLPVVWSTHPMVELVMDYVFDYSPSKIDLDEMLQKTQAKYQSVKHFSMPDNIESLKRDLTISTFPVMPAKTNERINAQDGTFFVCGMHLKKCKNSSFTYDATALEELTPEKICASPQTIVIQSSAKEKILKELDILGINEHKLFPDITHQIKYALKCIKDTSKTISQLAR